MSDKNNDNDNRSFIMSYKIKQKNDFRKHSEKYAVSLKGHEFLLKIMIYWRK